MRGLREVLARAGHLRAGERRPGGADRRRRRRVVVHPDGDVVDRGSARGRGQVQRLEAKPEVRGLDLRLRPSGAPEVGAAAVGAGRVGGHPVGRRCLVAARRGARLQEEDVVVLDRVRVARHPLDGGLDADDRGARRQVDAEARDVEVRALRACGQGGGGAHVVAGVDVRRGRPPGRRARIVQGRGSRRGHGHVVADLDGRVRPRDRGAADQAEVAPRRDRHRDVHVLDGQAARRRVRVPAVPRGDVRAAVQAVDLRAASQCPRDGGGPGRVLHRAGGRDRPRLARKRPRIGDAAALELKRRRAEERAREGAEGAVEDGERLRDPGLGQGVSRLTALGRAGALGVRGRVVDERRAGQREHAEDADRHDQRNALLGSEMTSE